MNNGRFSAARIAAALGKSKRAVQLGLRGVPPSAQLAIRGQLADAWSIEQLPHRFQSELDAIAEKSGYRNAEHLLQNPPRRFTPRDAAGRDVPLSEISETCVARAVRLRSAIALALQQIGRDGKCDDQLALQHYRRVFGNVSERHFRRLIKRTLQRDAGEERFDDLALYVDEVVTRKPEMRRRIAIGVTTADRTVLDELASVRSPPRPTLDEFALVWTVACEFIAREIQRGEKQKRAQRRLFKLLSNSAVALARTNDALKKLIRRKYLRWVDGGQTFSALEDKRPKSSGWHRAPELSDRDRKLLIAHARINCGGRVSQAVRELRDAGELSPAVTAHHIANPRNKSHVPKSIRDAIAGDVKRLDAYHHGPREHKLRGAYHTRDWSAVAAGDWFQADDLTAPVYFKSKGGGLTRGQFLPMIDERTTYILGFVLIQARNYNSFDIRNLITSACGEHGLPGCGFSFERGIWKSSKLIVGSRDCVDLDNAADMGLRRLGMRFRHAKTPKAKVIERTLGQLQDLMEGLPGYCGRNEVSDKFERFQRTKLDIEAGRVEAVERVFDADQLVHEFARIVDRYNAEPQQGRKLDGLSPSEGWKQLHCKEPRIRFEDQLMYFLASHLMKLKVGRNGITFQIGKQRFNFKGEETGRRQGDYIYGWFNPMRPDFLPCTTDLRGSEVFTVERSHDLPAVDASREELASESAKVEAHNGYARALYHTVRNALPASSFRRNDLIGSDAMKLGEQITVQRRAIEKRQASRNRLESEIARKARRAGVSTVVVHHSQEAAEALDEFAEQHAQLQRKLQEEE